VQLGDLNLFGNVVFGQLWEGVELFKRWINGMSVVMEGIGNG
jgi:hypothetical protein